jgi:SecD/SecF fusion protein
MQLKGLIKLFTICLILISLFQLSFTFIVSNFEKNQRAIVERKVAAENPGVSASPAKDLLIADKLRLHMDSMMTKKVYNLGFTDYTYQEAKEQELNLGLDLQGGMNVVLEVSLDEMVRNMSTNPEDPSLKAALASARQMQANSQSDFVSLFADAYNTQNPNGKLANLFAKSGSNGINFNSTNEQVIAKIKEEANGAIKRTHKVLLTRIDKFGVAQPNVNLDENRGIITVELAGMNNPERVRKYLQATAKLEFWRTYAIQDIAENLNKADKELAAYLSGSKDTSLTNGITKGAEANDSLAKSATPSSSDTGSLASLKNTKDTSKKDTSVAGLSDDEKRAKFQKENPLLYYLAYGNFFKGVDDKGNYTNECRINVIGKKDTSQLNKYLALPVVKNNLPSDLRIMYGPLDNDERNKDALVVYAIRTERGKTTAPLDGDVIEESDPDYDPSGRPAVMMNMDASGARTWAKMTKDNVGRAIAIALDDVIYSAPNINEEITGGRSQISGSFTTEQTQDLANILETGKLPAPANIIQEQVVGPTLGKEAVQGGLLSFIIAFGVIFILMLVYYNSAGWVANIALILNLLFTVGVLAALHATLTAAGIAGLVLTIGMAVDTNVIIFERIKEELKLGKSHEAAVDEGYRRSLSPVLDGHITVLMTAIILFIFGLGPVLGFATTQILGILLSLFCGILVSRLITDMRMSKGKHFNYFTSLSEKVFQRSHFQFIEWRKKAYVISIIVLILGVASFFYGFDYGVEFKGGRSYTVRMDKNVKTSEISEKLKSVFEVAPVVKTIGTDNQVNITTAYKIGTTSKEVEAEVAEKLLSGLKEGGFVGNTVSSDDFKSKYIMSSQTVQPSISDDLKKGAMWATFWSLMFISLYIFIRFRKWQYSLGTLVALLHDVFVTLAVFSFLRRVVPFTLEIDQHFIAAILTVIGFSMNDTVIVFDRIREYFRKRPGESKENIINSAINDTMSRTIMTSLTVFITLLILFIFGGEVTRGFAFAMMIGVVTGTYSSIFVASPILVDLDKSDSLTREVDKDAKIAALKEMA